MGRTLKIAEPHYDSDIVLEIVATTTMTAFTKLDSQMDMCSWSTKKDFGTYGGATQLCSLVGSQQPMDAVSAQTKRKKNLLFLQLSINKSCLEMCRLLGAADNVAVTFV